MGKAGVGVVATLTAPSSGAVSFEIGSSPYIVDVFATEAEQTPARSSRGASSCSGSPGIHQHPAR